MAVADEAKDHHVHETNILQRRLHPTLKNRSLQIHITQSVKRRAQMPFPILELNKLRNGQVQQFRGEALLRDAAVYNLLRPAILKGGDWLAVRYTNGCDEITNKPEQALGAVSGLAAVAKVTCGCQCEEAIAHTGRVLTVRSFWIMACLVSTAAVSISKFMKGEMERACVRTA